MLFIKSSDCFRYIMLSAYAKLHGLIFLAFIYIYIHTWTAGYFIVGVFNFPGGGSAKKRNGILG